jgi:hypothetical protein
VRTGMLVVARDDQTDSILVGFQVYNLGYLPGGDKSITTLSKDTLESLADVLGQPTANQRDRRRPLVTRGGLVRWPCQQSTLTEVSETWWTAGQRDALPRAC